MEQSKKGYAINIRVRESAVENSARKKKQT